MIEDTGFIVLDAFPSAADGAGTSEAGGSGLISVEVSPVSKMLKRSCISPFLEGAVGGALPDGRPVASDTDVRTVMLGSCVLKGGGGGGGAMVGKVGSAFNVADRDILEISGASSSIPSWALGTMSDRMSRSSEERANELLGVDVPSELRLRENRVKNRDTAEAGC